MRNSYGEELQLTAVYCGVCEKRKEVYAPIGDVKTAHETAARDGEGWRVLEIYGADDPPLLRLRCPKHIHTF